MHITSGKRERKRKDVQKDGTNEQSQEEIMPKRKRLRKPGQLEAWMDVQKEGSLERRKSWRMDVYKIQTNEKRGKNIT